MLTLETFEDNLCLNVIQGENTQSFQLLLICYDIKVLQHLVCT